MKRKLAAAAAVIAILGAGGLKMKSDHDHLADLSKSEKIEMYCMDTDHNHGSMFNCIMKLEEGRMIMATGHGWEN